MLQDALSEAMKVSSLRKAEVFFGRYHTLHGRRNKELQCVAESVLKSRSSWEQRRNQEGTRCDQEESRFPEGLCGDRGEEVVEDGFGLCGCGEDKPCALLHTMVEVERRQMAT